MGSAVTVQRVHHRLAGRQVLSIDGLEVPPGGRLAVLGPNGAGKSTLLRLVAGLEAPTSGSVAVDGVEASRRSLGDRRRSAFVTQRPGLLSETAVRNVEIPLRWRGRSRAGCRARAEEALDRLGILHLADRRAEGLSGGERQRVSLARALALDPDLLLLDEPAAGLDVAARQELLADLQHVVADSRSCTVVHVTHRPAEALCLADTVAVLVGGVLRQVASPDELLRRPVDAAVARLVGYETLLPATAGPDGTVEVAGHPVTERRCIARGRLTAACFAAGVRLGPADGRGLPAVVVHAAPGPGHGLVTLSALDGQHTVVAHPRHDHPLPRAGDRVTLTLEPALTVLVPGDGHQLPSTAPADTASATRPPGSADRGWAAREGVGRVARELT